MRCLLEGSLAALGRLKRRALPQAVVGPPASHSITLFAPSLLPATDRMSSILPIMLCFSEQSAKEILRSTIHVDEVMPLHHQLI